MFMFCYFAVEETDLERVFQLPPTTYIGGKETALPLKEIIKRLEVMTVCIHIMFPTLSLICQSHLNLVVQIYATVYMLYTMCIHVY